MNNFDLNAPLDASQVQVSVSCGAEGISYHKKADIWGFGLFNHLVTPAFDEFSVSNYHLLIEKLAQSFVANH